MKGGETWHSAGTDADASEEDVVGTDDAGSVDVVLDADAVVLDALVTECKTC